jgi:hypothetical protein
MGAAVVGVAGSVPSAVERDPHVLIVPQQDVQFVDDAVSLLHPRERNGAENLRSAPPHLAASWRVEN